MAVFIPYGKWQWKLMTMGKLNTYKRFLSTMTMANKEWDKLENQYKLKISIKENF